LLRRALLAACRSGCDVRLILPERSDVAVFPSLSSHYYRELLRAGARIFLYQPGVLHAKALLVDEQAVLGSSNWNYRSTLHDLELDVVLRDPDAVKPLEQTLLADMADSREVAFEDTLRPGLVSWVLYGLRYWM
jgi:cardiolipin synthase